MIFLNIYIFFFFFCPCTTPSFYCALQNYLLKIHFTIFCCRSGLNVLIHMSLSANIVVCLSCFLSSLISVCVIRVEIGERERERLRTIPCAHLKLYVGFCVHVDGKYPHHPPDTHTHTHTHTKKKRGTLRKQM